MMLRYEDDKKTKEGQGGRENREKSQQKKTETETKTTIIS
jgi:hypothetical protein